MTCPRCFGDLPISGPCPRCYCCRRCGSTTRPFRRGRCKACAEYLRRTGEERPLELVEAHVERKAARKGPARMLGVDVAEILKARCEITPEGCWVWTGSLTNDGYGEVTNGRGGSARMHRVAYEALVGPIPEGLQIDHLCRNRACCNPSHLEPVTPAENTRRAPATRLTAKDAHEIGRLYREGMPPSKIAEHYEISAPHAYKVATGRKWKSAV